MEQKRVNMLFNKALDANEKCVFYFYLKTKGTFWPTQYISSPQNHLAGGLIPPAQSYSNQDSMVVAQKQKYRSMEQDRKPRDKPMYIWSPYL